jgi:hypothetical protein
MDRRIVRAERALDLAALAAGFILLLAWPERPDNAEAPASQTRPTRERG